MALTLGEFAAQFRGFIGKIGRKKLHQGLRDKNDRYSD